MIFTATSLPGVYLIDIEPIGDSRGFFGRFWCSKEFEAQGLSFEVAQINVSHNAEAGTLRGLHFQRAPHAEAKVVACTSGSVFDVAVDVRPGSPTYLQWLGVELNSEDRQMLYIPAGFAHGYQTLEDNTGLLYLVSEFYTPDAESGLRFDDPAMGIEWPLPVASISDKDKGWDLASTAVP
jgi:dTDP-4-dehydrorhamnose 3,5-epimerase